MFFFKFMASKTHIFNGSSLVYDTSVNIFFLDRDVNRHLYHHIKYKYHESNSERQHLRIIKKSIILNFQKQQKNPMVKLQKLWFVNEDLEMAK